MNKPESIESETPAAVAGAARGSATAARYEMALTDMARGRLTQHPHLQAEAIARHYTAHATIALQLLKMLECRRHTETWPELERSIQMLVDEIKTNHRHDFGIALEWPNAELSGGSEPSRSAIG
jgi:hypothetical protein